MASLSLVFDILARDRASRELNDVGDAADRTGSKLGTIGKAAGAAAVGGVAVLGAGLVAAFKGGLEELSGNQEALAQFSAGLKSTGNVAGITAEQMADLADSIEAKTGSDGAAIVSGGALLATFTNVRNEVGKGNDVFSRATQAGVDLAARGFGSIESNAVSLGKALNDPIKGITALGKQGVSFTESQKATIESLVQTGNTLEAQKIILAAVEEQVGGSAEAYGKTLPGQLARASAAFDGVKETLATNLLPIITKLLDFINDKLLPAFSAISARVGPALSTFFTGTLVPSFQKVIDIVRTVTTTLVEFGQKLPTPLVRVMAGAVGALTAVIVTATAVNKTAALATAAYTAAKAIFVSTTNAETGAVTLSTVAQVRANVTRAASTVATVASTVATAASTVATNVFTAAQTALNFALRANPIGLVVTALGLLAAGLVTAYQRSETFRRIVDGAFKAVRSAVSSVADKVGDFIDVLGRIKVPKALERIADIAGSIGGAFGRAGGAIRDAVSGIGDGPGRPPAGGGGTLLRRVQGLIAGSGMSISSTYRTPARNAAVGGSPRSYHLDPRNPAVDVVGPPAQLDRLYRQLAGAPGVRELLWRTKGHFDHLHVAHNGGTVEPSWGTLPGLKANERAVITEIGEVIAPQSDMKDVVAGLARVAYLIERLPREYQQMSRAGAR